MYAVIGANGFLGSYCIKSIIDNTDDHIIATTRNITRVKKNHRIDWHYLDIQSDNSINKLILKLKKYDNIKIIYLAAFHNPDEVEKNKNLAWHINVTCLSNFINNTWFAKKIFYASTDSVYGNSINGYHFKENDTLSPINFYGHNKCAAESILLHLNRNIIRFPFLISPSLIYKPHFYDRIVEQISIGNPIEMYNDSYRSTLSFENAGYLLIKLMELNDPVPQVINICGDRDLSKFDVGQIIAERESLPKDLIKPISFFSNPKFSSKRAQSTLMDNQMLKKILNLSYIDIFKPPM